MGEVYKAWDTRLQRTVAIKLLPAEIASQSDRVRRFHQEARAASALNHPHIVSIYDTGEDGSTHFIVMELIDGVPFDVWKERQKPDLRRILATIIQVADALAVAHHRGIVHRDIKPANLLKLRSQSRGRHQPREMEEILSRQLRGSKSKRAQVSELNQIPAAILDDTFSKYLPLERAPLRGSL